MNVMRRNSIYFEDKRKEGTNFLIDGGQPSDNIADSEIKFPRERNKNYGGKLVKTHDEKGF